MMLQSGDTIPGPYIVLDFLGEGWEGEVYLVKEQSTGVERAAKVFYNKTSRFYMQKLHRLRDCSILIHYHGHVVLYLDGKPHDVLLSEYIDGQLLSDIMKKQRKFHPYPALHFLHALAEGMEDLHLRGEYHGDLHMDNIVVLGIGLKWELKLLDIAPHGKATGEHRRQDVLDIVQVFYEMIGGRKEYHKLPKSVKEIICGMRSDLILKKFRSAGKLREYLEMMEY